MTIYLDNETTWPADVLDYLKHHHDLFLAWELRHNGIESPAINVSDYDNAIHALRVVLRNHLLHGYHCTRLTKFEVQHIQSNGMQLPNEVMLRERIQLILKIGLIELEIAELLENKNQASDRNRAGSICFCFYPPYHAGQWGIERFFRSWGGEALYNSHEDDPKTGPVLKGIGTPCLIEAYVPIASLETHSYLTDKLIRRFLVNRGLQTIECMNHNDRANLPVSAQSIRRIILHPDSEFLTLTGCDTWSPPLTLMR